MKSNVIILFLLILLISACNKNELVKNDQEYTADKAAVNQILESKNFSEQKSMYSLLNKYEKALLWQNKFETTLLNKSLNEEQQLFITKLKDEIVPKVFISTNNAEKQKFDDAEIKTTAIKLFGVADAHSLLATINGVISINAVAIPPAENCSCSQSSDWCDSGQSCQPSSCTNTGGCGTFLAYQCNGKCKNNSIIFN